MNADDIYVKDFMVKDVVSIGLKDKMGDAYASMKINGIRHLPVVDDENVLIGIFSQTDLNRAYSPRETESGWYYDREELNLLKLEHFMTTEPTTLNPNDTLRKACQVLARNRIGCIPVVEEGSNVLCGILSYVDVLKTIAEKL